MKNIKIRNIFLICSLLLLSSCSYNILSSVIKKVEVFVFRLYEGFGNAFQDLFFTLAVIFIVIEATRIMLNKNGQLLNIVKIGLTVVFVSAIAFSPAVFEDFLYKPIIFTIYNLSAFVIDASKGDVGNSFSDPKMSIKSMLDQLDDTVASIANVSDRMAQVASDNNILGYGWTSLKFRVLQLLYYGLQAVFLVLFTVGIVATHIFLALFPFALCFIAFKEMRGIAFNIFRATSTYALIPFFVSIAMGITLGALDDLTVQANEYFAQIELNPDAIPPSFVGEAFFIGILSWFFHVKASEFASQTVGGQISNFGQNFASAVGAGVGIVKSPLSVARLTREVAGHTKALASTLQSGAGMAGSAMSNIGKGASYGYNMAKSMSSGKSSPSQKNNASDIIAKSLKKPMNNSLKAGGQKALPYNGIKMNQGNDGWKVVGTVKTLQSAPKMLNDNTNLKLN